MNEQTLGEELEQAGLWIIAMAHEDWTKFTPEQNKAWARLLIALGEIAEAFGDFKDEDEAAE